MRVACALVSFALVATTPIVVFSPARGGRIAEPERRILRASANVSSGLRTPATILPVDGSTMSPTAFTATVGSGKPVIGILGEYDALPGLAQDAVPFRQPRPGNGYGDKNHEHTGPPGKQH